MMRTRTLMLATGAIVVSVLIEVHYYTNGITRSLPFALINIVVCAAIFFGLINLLLFTISKLRKYWWLLKFPSIVFIPLTVVITEWTIYLDDWVQGDTWHKLIETSSIVGGLLVSFTLYSILCAMIVAIWPSKRMR